MKIDATSNTRLVELLRKIERTQLEELYNRHDGSNVEELVSMIIFFINPWASLYFKKYS